MLVKPHVITLLVLPYMLFYWYRTRDFLDHQPLQPVKSLKDLRVRQLFLDSLIFSLFNPVILPSPVFTRSLNLFLFRYSNDLSFVISSLCGWLGGYILFINLAKLLKVRIERDSSLNYLSIKSKINQIFSIIFLTLCLLYLGRAPVPLFTKKIRDRFKTGKNKIVKSLWLTKPWPNILFDYYKWNRPFRYIPNGSNGNSPVKKQVSQYFFDICSSDGRQKISFTSLPSYSIFKKDLKEYLNISDISSSSENIYKEWIDNKKQRKDNLDNELTSRIRALDHKFLIINVTQNKNELSDHEKNVSIKTYDPFLNKRFRGRIAISKSPWILNEKSLESTKRQIAFNLSKKNNKLKNWISIRWQRLECQNLPLPWEPLNPDARNFFSLLTEEASNDAKPRTNLQQVGSFDEQTLVTSNEPNNFSEFFAKETKHIHYLFENKNENSSINWEDIFLNLSSEQRESYFKYLRNIKWQKFLNSWKDLISNNSIKVKDIIFLMTQTLKIHKKYQVEEIEKEMPRWTSKLTNYKFDVIGITFNDVRYRKLKNLDYVLRTLNKEYGTEKIQRLSVVKRFSQQSDFRRNLIIGSMRARRRKTLIWNYLQLKTHSPFFLRILDKSTPLQSPLEVSDKINVKLTFAPFKKTKQRFIPFFSNSDKKGFAKEGTEADRIAIANRWDFASAHWGRGCLLIIQSYLRKYIVIPVLIISKNIIRILIFQVPEWKEDWNQWTNEIYIKCNYDGTEVSVHQLPSLWHREGLQIKILCPFYLKPWHNSRLKQVKNKDNNLDTKIYDEKIEIKKKTLLDDKTKNSYIFSKKKKIDYGYLTVWGSQTDSPFGNTKKQPSFRKPIIKELKKKRKEFLSKIKQNLKIYYKLFPLEKKYSIYNKSNNPAILKTRVDKSTNNVIFESEPNNEYKNERNFNLNNEFNYELPIQITPESGDNLSSESLNQFKYATKIITNNLEDSINPESNGIEQINEQTFSNQININTNLKGISKKYPNDIKKLKLKKILIQFYQKIFQLRKKSTQIIQKQIYPLNIFSKKINRNIYQFIFYLIRFNKQLIINLTKNILTICNEVISFDNNIFYSQTNNNKSVNQNFIIPNEEVQNPKINPNRDIKLVSQADVFHEIRQLKTRNKSYLMNLLEYWKLDFFIREDFKVLSDKKGVFSDFKEPQILSEEERQNWLRYLHGCNLPSYIWCKIAPRTWRNEVTKHWKMEKNFLNHFDEDISYAFTTDPSWERTKKLSKRYKYNLLSYSYLDFTKNSEMTKIPMWQSKEKQIIYNNRIREIRKSQLVNNEKKNKNFIMVDFQKIDKQKNLYFEFKMNLWLFPEVLKTKNIFGSEVIIVPNSSVLIEKHNRTLKDRQLLEDRESHESIYQWKRTSKELEKIVKKLRDLMFMTILIENQDEFVSFPANIVENLETLVFSINRDNINKTFKNLEYRLPRVLDDQILMYKTISTLLKFKNRFKRKIKLNIFEPRLGIIENNEKTFSSYYNIEDILLPRRCIELRILNSPDLEKFKNQNVELDRNTFGKKGQRYKQLIGKEKNFANNNQIIKRFLWPSYRLEDLACMNRFWFNTNNGSRFAMLRISMYPSLYY